MFGDGEVPPTTTRENPGGNVCAWAMIDAYARQMTNKMSVRIRVNTNHLKKVSLAGCLQNDDELVSRYRFPVPAHTTC